jgi:hypothetical protein
MKLSAVALNVMTLLATFATTTQASGFFVVIHSEDPSKHPVGACKGEDTLLQAELGLTIMGIPGVQDLNNKRNLRSLTDSGFCRYYCQGFRPGTCWQVYPRCYPIRRALDEEAEPVEDSESLPDTITEDHSLTCSKAVIAIEEKMQKFANNVTTPECKAALMDKKTFQCFNEE